jgi:hypothetical protein
VIGRNQVDDRGKTDWDVAKRQPITFGRAGAGGKAGAGLTQPPLQPQPQQRPQVQAAMAEPDTEAKVPTWRALLLVVLVVFGLFWLEALFASTSLITPLDGTFLLVMRGLGVLVGLALGVVIFITDATMNAFRRALVALSLPFFIGFLFDGIAWRLADWLEFGLSAARFEPAQYPVLRSHHGRKGAQDTLEIDPFHTGEAADIPIPAAQYDALRATASDYCVTVLQRKSASGAIEIRTDGRYTFQPPIPATLAPC